MERPTYPFPLAVNSSHHSHYHRFLLGADPAVVAPFPKPYCAGALAADFGRLAGNLNLQRWSKLYHGAFPWVAGFGPVHYDLGNVPAHRPLPREYSRPERRFAAYDFVQIADPSVSALALVAGDRRVLERFVALCDDGCARIEAGAGVRGPGPAQARFTGRILAGQFAEPNNRWLMPFLHVHTRVLNFTSFRETPSTLACVDSASLARAGQRAQAGWTERQAQALGDLGYRVSLVGQDAPLLAVEGVSPKLIAAARAPRLAVLRVLERIILGDTPPEAGRLAAEMPPSVIAAMVDHIESALAGAPWFHKPAKLGLPFEGPWRTSVRDYLRSHCPSALSQIDGAAARAKAAPYGAALFPSPSRDPAHVHVPSLESLDSALQLPLAPELGTARPAPPGVPAASLWLSREFERALEEVHGRIAACGTDEPLISLGRLVAAMDQLGEGASADQLKQSRALLEVELERRAKESPVRPERSQERAPSPRGRLLPLEQLFDNFVLSGRAPSHDIGGRSL